MKQTVNLAIQLLPLHHEGDKYGKIDKAIQLIRDSGLKYRVCPFETVIEGPYDEVMSLINEINTSALQNGCEEILVNMKLHMHKSKNLHIEDKTGKYDS